MMRPMLHDHFKLSWSQKCSRLKERWKDPNWRRYAKLLIAGKVLGLVALAAILFIGPRLIGASNVIAQTTAPSDPYAAIKPVDHINALNTGWVLLGAFLVF